MNTEQLTFHCGKQLQKKSSIMTGLRGHLVVFLSSFLVLWVQELLNKLLHPVAAVLVGAAAQTRGNHAIFFM